MSESLDGNSILSRPFRIKMDPDAVMMIDAGNLLENRNCRSHDEHISSNSTTGSGDSASDKSAPTQFIRIKMDPDAVMSETGNFSAKQNCRSRDEPRTSAAVGSRNSPNHSSVSTQQIRIKKDPDASMVETENLLGNQNYRSHNEASAESRDSASDKLVQTQQIRIKKDPDAVMAETENLSGNPNCGSYGESTNSASTATGDSASDNSILTQKIRIKKEPDTAMVETENLPGNQNCGSQDESSTHASKASRHSTNDKSPSTQQIRIKKDPDAVIVERENLPETRNCGSHDEDTISASVVSRDPTSDKSAATQQIRFKKDPDAVMVDTGNLPRNRNCGSHDEPTISVSAGSRDSSSDKSTSTQQIRIKKDPDVVMVGTGNLPQNRNCGSHDEPTTSASAGCRDSSSDKSASTQQIRIKKDPDAVMVDTGNLPQNRNCGSHDEPTTSASAGCRDSSSAESASTQQIRIKKDPNAVMVERENLSVNRNFGSHDEPTTSASASTISASDESMSTQKIRIKKDPDAVMLEDGNLPANENCRNQNESSSVSSSSRDSPGRKSATTQPIRVKKDPDAVMAETANFSENQNFGSRDDPTSAPVRSTFTHVGRSAYTQQIVIKMDPDVVSDEGRENSSEYQHRSTRNNESNTSPMDTSSNSQRRGKKRKHDDENCFDEHGRPLVTNFFEFTSKPLPKVEPTKVTPYDVYPNPPPTPQIPHYNRHTEAEESGYAKDGPNLPIKIFRHDSDSEAEDEPIQKVDNRQRYFKRDFVLGKYNFNFYKFPEIKNLAVYQYREKIIDAVMSNRVVVVEGFTGCGKTTQVPQFILDHFVENKLTCNIVVTQPRRIAAQSVAQRVCMERGWEMGTVVGFQVGMDTKTNRHETMLTYMTTGVLLQKLIHSKSLKQYSHIIVDEVHERDLETDFLLLVIKKILMDDHEEQEGHVKLILMSATLNASKFAQYYVTQKIGTNEVARAPIIKIPQSKAKFEVEEIFLDELMSEGDINEMEFTRDKALLHSDVYDVAVKTITGIDDLEREEVFNISADPRMKSRNHYSSVKLDKRGSVLVFLPGFLEIETLFKRLMEENKSYMARNGGNADNYAWNIIPLHSSITAEEQSRVFQPSQKGYRKIILSTNIAESSITVPDVVYVIDFCLTKSLNVDPRTNFSCLRMVWASISQCIQRKGRTGRVAPGKVYRLVPRRFYNNELDKDAVPEMLKSGLENVVLRVKNLNMGSPKNILALAIDAPPLSGIERAVVNLKEVGALTVFLAKNNDESSYDTCDGDLTFMGRVMSQLPISHQCARLILLGHVFGVLRECIIIAAGLSVKSPFSSPFQRKLDSYISKLNWAQKSYSDCFAILHLYRYWYSKFGESGGGDAAMRQEKIWGRGAFVQISAMKEIRSVAEELESRLQKFGIVPSPYCFENSTDGELSKEQGVMLKVSIAGAFYPNYFHRHRPEKNYERERSKEVNGNDLFTTVYYKGFPQGNNGTLYARHIAEKLAIGLDIPRITFEGQKVLVMFDSSSEKIGPINRGVYRATKLRQIREKVAFRVLWKEDEYRYLDEQQQIKQESGFNYIHCPAQVVLPGVEIPGFFAIVTHVVSPSQFWVVYSVHEQKLNEMTQIINQHRVNKRLEHYELTPGAFCLAPYADGSNSDYYRARIRAITPGNQALVYYVDYGNSAWIECQKLCSFSAVHQSHEVHSRPCLAVECRLAKIKPAIVYGSVWHDEANRRFSNFVHNKKFNMKFQVYCVVKSVISGTLFGVDKSEPDGPKLDVNQKLVDDGYADQVPENYVCELNHQARERIDLMIGDDNQIKAHNREQLGQMSDISYVNPPSNGRVNVELKGPWSPLELEFMSLCHSSSSKQVAIDDGSVNSVALDHEPTAPTSRLVVASSVSIQDKSGRVVARDTTMMPAIPGLMALMAIIFTPKIELRTDKSNTRYTGVLCGLGTDPDYNAAIYQDHDVEIVFDTEIDDDDIKRINGIRYCMNLILRDSAEMSNLGPTYKNVVSAMFKLMKKTRKRLDEETWPQEMYNWNKIDKKLIIPPSSPFPYDHKDIFLPHSTVALQKYYPPNATWGDFAI